ncbi:hypothetical protein CDFC105_84037 [Clostridioides difficile]|nr:hypothetical protein CDFC105_84037 [Clostridioides difficile]
MHLMMDMPQDILDTLMGHVMLQILWMKYMINIY